MSGREKGKRLVRYGVWAALYYDNSAKILPRDGDYYGEFMAVDEADLKQQIEDAGYDPDSARWEQSP